MAVRLDNDINDNSSNESDEASSTKLWVFGYGSLVWNPGFKFTRSAIGYVRGYARRFWQGNMVQRGTNETPGRVVTLVEDSECMTWGTAYELSDDEVAMTFSYLENRESTLGGYKTTIVEFNSKDGKSFPVLVYIATPNNACYLGPAPMKELANQIVSACGTSGHNVEYVIRLADFMRETLPEVSDEHLYLLEEYVRMKIKKQNLCFYTLMGPNYIDPQLTINNRRSLSPSPPENAVDQGAIDGAAAADVDLERPREDRTTFLYASRVVPKKLRCLNV